MPPLREIRASYTRDTVVVYQAYSDRIAAPSLAAGRFVAPFSRRRMTWIKPSFLWLMARSRWGRAAGQPNILAVRIRRDGFEQALASGVLTHFTPSVHAAPERWAAAFERAEVHVQWDPERSIRGEKLPHRSIQIGISRHLIDAYADEWVVQLTDLTPTVRKMRDLIARGRTREAARHLPPERPYPVDEAIARRLGVGRS